LRCPQRPFHASLDSREAYANGGQSDDISAEQDKLRWADTVILQFPLWWFSTPAILKGWVDRVYAYGVGEHSDRHWGDRYGEGAMTGKCAMLVVTKGCRPTPSTAAARLASRTWRTCWKGRADDWMAWPLTR